MWGQLNSLTKLVTEQASQAVKEAGLESTLVRACCSACATVPHAAGARTAMPACTLHFIGKAKSVRACLVAPSGLAAYGRLPPPCVRACGVPPSPPSMLPAPRCHMQNQAKAQLTGQLDKIANSVLVIEPTSNGAANGRGPAVGATSTLQPAPERHQLGSRAWAALLSPTPALLKPTQPPCITACRPTAAPGAWASTTWTAAQGPTGTM